MRQHWTKARLNPRKAISISCCSISGVFSFQRFRWLCLFSSAACNMLIFLLGWFHTLCRRSLGQKIPWPWPSPTSWSFHKKLRIHFCSFTQWPLRDSLPLRPSLKDYPAHMLPGLSSFWKHGGRGLKHFTLVSVIPLKPTCRMDDIAKSTVSPGWTLTPLICISTAFISSCFLEHKTS